ncbi:MAG: hypothetical protein RSC25_07155 [Christensenella sp.]
MKKILAVIMAMLLLMAVTACGVPLGKPSEVPAPSEPPTESASAEVSAVPTESAVAEESAGMENPWTDAADAAEVEKLTGVKLNPIPEDATDAVYRVLKTEKLVEVDFTWKDGDEFTFRMISGKPGEDISGVFEEFKETADLKKGEQAYTVYFDEAAGGLADWYDEANDYTCSVSSPTANTKDKMTAICEALIIEK